MESHHITLLLLVSIWWRYIIFLLLWDRSITRFSHLLFGSWLHPHIWLITIGFLSLEILGSFLWMSLVFSFLTLHKASHRIASNQPTLVSVDRSAIIHRSDLHYSTWNPFVPFLSTTIASEFLSLFFSFEYWWDCSSTIIIVSHCSLERRTERSKAKQSQAKPKRINPTKDAVLDLGLIIDATLSLSLPVLTRFLPHLLHLLLLTHLLYFLTSITVNLW